MAQWKSNPMQSDKRSVIKFNGGLNNGAPSLEIADNQSIDETGWDTDAYPALHTAKDRLAYGASGAAQTNLLSNFTTTQLVRAVGTKLQYESTGVWTDIAGTWTDTDWDATNFEVAGAPALILTNGTDAVQYWNGTALAPLSADTPKGKYVANDTIRVWIAKDDIIYYCKFEDPSDWTAANNAGSVQYYTQNGGNITGLRNFYDGKFIWKADSMAIIYGTDYFNYRLVEVSNQIGCVNFKTIQEVSTPQGSVLYWLGRTDVYMSTGGAPAALGQTIRGYLDSINQTYIDRCYGATDGYRYFLGLVTGSNTQPDTMLMYDPRFRMWRVRRIGDNLRYSALLNGIWYAGDATGQTYQMDNAYSTGTAWSYTTKDFDEGMKEAEKEYFALHLSIQTPTGSTFTVEVSMNQGSTWTTVGDPITASPTDQNVNIIVPLDTVPLGNWGRFRFRGTGEVKIYEVQRYYRLQPVQF